MGVALLAHEDETLIVGADTANNRLIFFGQDASGRMGRSAIASGCSGSRLGGSAPGSSRGQTPSILALSDDGFAIMRLLGRACRAGCSLPRTGPTPRTGSSTRWRPGTSTATDSSTWSCSTRRSRCPRSSRSPTARKLYLATEFEVFESRLFTRGSAREYEPSAALIADLTGDGKDDLALVVHDRVIVFPQMTEETVR